MNTIRHAVTASLFATFLLLAISNGARAQDNDLAEVQRYKLTDAGLAKYSQASKKLAALPGRAAAACSDDDDSESQSIGQVAAKLESVPAAKPAIESTGMTPREYVVFSMSLLQNGLASWALDQPGGKLPAGVSKANVDFVKKHDAELKSLQALTPADRCDDAEETTEDEEAIG